MSNELLHPRLAESTLDRAPADSPVVLIHGPRQSGKTTLARVVGGPRGYSYFSFDDDGTREAATSDPAGFIADLPEKCILDEVQRVPALFTSMKAAVDRDRRPGRFLLTGSANVLLIPKLADSLAGRMELMRKLRDAAGKRFVAGVVLYDGTATVRFGDGLFAVPDRKLWEAT